MPELGLRTFDTSVQEANAWLNEISEEMNHPDPQMAYHALRGTLSALRDRLPVEEAAHLSAQLPLLVRGIYYEGFRPAELPGTYDLDGFLDRVNAELEQAGGQNPENAARAVCAVLNRHLDGGQVRQVRESLPETVRRVWPENGA